MKSERRHQLQTNTLAQGIHSFPELWRQYGTKILLAICAILAIYLFVQHQMRQTKERQEQAEEALSAAVDGMNSLQRIPFNTPPAAVARRRDIQEQTERAVQQVLQDGKDDTIKAEALLVRGDLNWNLVQLPEIPGATTQPSLRMKESDEELLETAKKAYDSASKTPGPRASTVTMARLGLAAVAEQRRQWDAAKSAYDSIVDDAAAPGPFKEIAKEKRDNLAKLQKPLLIGHPASAPTTQSIAEQLEQLLASTRPSTTEPTTQSTTKPGPAPKPGPTTKPASTAPTQPTK